YSASTVFSNTGTLILTSTSGELATLTFDPIPHPPAVVQTVNTPTNINYGIFTVACQTCTTSVGATFSAFTFTLFLTDVTDGATGIFTGSSTGGNVFAQSSTLGVNWVPLQLGPGTSNAFSGNFGNSFFTITQQTLIVAPNSGDNVGQTTVQGSVASLPGPVDSVPEPGTLGLIGASLLGLGFMRRRASRG
ncbi:MAG: PEP-CTERM sorting domain-containing protein, partial [Bryobacteraceae bacterium]